MLRAPSRCLHTRLAFPAHFLPRSAPTSQCPHLALPSLSASSPGPSVRNFCGLTGPCLGALLAERSLHLCLSLRARDARKERMRRFTALHTNSVPNSLANYGRASFPGHVRGCLTELGAVLSQRGPAAAMAATEARRREQSHLAAAPLTGRERDGRLLKVVSSLVCDGLGTFQRPFPSQIKTTTHFASRACTQTARMGAVKARERRSETRRGKCRNFSLSCPRAPRAPRLLPPLAGLSSSLQKETEREALRP